MILFDVLEMLSRAWARHKHVALAVTPHVLVISKNDYDCLDHIKILKHEGYMVTSITTAEKSKLLLESEDTFTFVLFKPDFRGVEKLIWWECRKIILRKYGRKRFIFLSVYEHDMLLHSLLFENAFMSGDKNVDRERTPEGLVQEIKILYPL